MKRKQRAKIIKDFLTRARNVCEFKKAFLPRGWICVNIEQASKDLAVELEEKTDKKEN